MEYYADVRGGTAETYIEEREGGLSSARGVICAGAHVKSERGYMRRCARQEREGLYAQVRTSRARGSV